MISLLFSDENTLVQWLVRKATRSWCSHVDVVLPNGALLGARPNWEKSGGVQIRPAGYHTFTKQLRVDLDCSLDVEASFHAFLRLQIGKPYDWRADLTWFFDHQWTEDDSWMCSELVAAALVASGYFAPLYATASRISPADLLLVLSSRISISTP